MPDELPVRRVEVSFVYAAPTERVERASGVSEVETDGSILRCVVHGSFQPFLEALRGHEVVGFSSTSPPDSACPREDDPPSTPRRGASSAIYQGDPRA